jgi:hypothetical protein
MKLFIDDIADNGKLPKKCTCDAQGISPLIKWQDIPEETKSLALTVIDPDAVGGTFIHWLVCDIIPSVSSIPEAGPPPQGSREISNSSAGSNYYPACPPSGEHRYIFTLYALNKETLENVSMDNFVSMAETHALDKAEITALYKRS